MSFWWRIRVHPAIVNASRYLTWRFSASSIHLISFRFVSYRIASYRIKFTIHSAVHLVSQFPHSPLSASLSLSPSLRLPFCQFWSTGQQCPNAIFLGQRVNGSRSVYGKKEKMTKMWWNVKRKKKSGCQRRTHHARFLYLISCTQWIVWTKNVWSAHSSTSSQK